MRTTLSARVESLDVLDDARWDDALAGSRRPFRFSHRAAAGRALEAAFDGYRYTPSRVTYSDGTVALFPLIRVQRRLAAMTMALGMPLGLEGTPIPLSGSVGPEHIAGLFVALEDCGRLELSGGAGGSPPPLGADIRVLTHALDLSDGFDAVWRGAFSDKNRNMCRKAERAGVTVAEESTDDGVDAYHGLYAASTARWGYDTPPYPRALLSGFLASGAAELWLARDPDGEAIAGAIVLSGSHDVLYWSGAMNRDFRSVAPSNAVVRAAIESACDRGLRYFDFGASAGMSGVESFKRSFGASERPYLIARRSTGRYRRLEAAVGRARRLRGGR